MSLKIISLNTWRGGVHKPLLKFLRESDADVYCLQELLSYPRPEILDTESSSDLVVPVHLDILTDIQEALSGYQCFFHPATQGYTFDDTRLSYPLLYGLATFVRIGIPVVESSVAMVHDQYRWLVPGEFPTPRNAHCVRVWDPDGENFFVIAHMHGLWIPEGKHDTPERAVQALRLIELVKSVARNGANDRIVVCGDFNLLPQSETFTILERSLGLQSLIEKYEIRDTRTSFYTKPERYADYALVSPRVRVTHFEALAQPEVSDHRALLLECR